MIANRTISLSILAFCLAVAAMPQAGAADSVVKASLRACPTGTAIGDVGSCGKIWKIGSGEALLHSNGKLSIQVKGLVLNDASTGEFNGTADGVTHVVGAVLCAGAVAAQTEWSPLSKDGTARINAKLSLPSSCIAPTLVVREVWDGKVGGWLAAAGY
jgi:hypothetical protein